MKKEPNKIVVQVPLALSLALLGPFLLPPHVVGVYIPLGSQLARSEVWHGEPNAMFYLVFFLEWFVYSFLIYGLFRLVSRFMR